MAGPQNEPKISPELNKRTLQLDSTLHGHVTADEVKSRGIMHMSILLNKSFIILRILHSVTKNETYYQLFPNSSHQQIISCKERTNTSKFQALYEIPSIGVNTLHRK